MRTVVFRPAAAADIDDARRWYEAQRPGLGDEFLAAASGTVDRIREMPFGFPVVHRQTRRALLSRFPYGLFYRVDDDRIVVVACFHLRRDPRVWRRR